jgi:serine/threonine protein kinase
MTNRSPERLSLVETYTYKCDIWSLGLILFELATGKPIPYAELGGKFNYFKVCQKIINDQPPELPANLFSLEISDFLKKW